MKRIKNIIGFSLLVAYIVVMMSFVNVAYNESYCSAVDIVILDSLVTRFVQTRDIDQILKDGDYKLLTKLPSEINLNEVENRIKGHSSIKDCDCYFLANKTMRIEVSQRRPIARVLTDKYNFYIDELGGEMPPSNFYTAHVPVITGNVNREMVSGDLFKIVDIITQDSFWEAQIEQVHVEHNGEYTLIPRAGRQRIELGTADNLEVKFKSLKALYLQIFNNNSWNKYKTISLKYDGQVVCTKK